MSSAKDFTLRSAKGKRNYLEEVCKQRKSTEHPRFALLLAGCSVFAALVILSAKIACLSSEVETQGLKLHENQKLLQQVLEARGRVSNNGDWIKQQNVARGFYQGDENIIDPNQGKSADAKKVRYKRATSRAKRRPRRPHGIPGPCHLEGRNGPNIISYPGVPRQSPRSASECILWRRPDTEPPAYCLMETVNDVDDIGVKYIRIDRSGFYHVYVQLTYQSVPNRLSGTGYRVERSQEGTDTVDILLSATSPPKASSRRGLEESQYTSGVFRLDHGDLLAVYPQRAYSQFIMSESRSFFGVMYMGRFDL